MTTHRCAQTPDREIRYKPQMSVLDIGRISSPVHPMTLGTTAWCHRCSGHLYVYRGYLLRVKMTRNMHSENPQIPSQALVCYVDSTSTCRRVLTHYTSCLIILTCFSSSNLLVYPLEPRHSPCPAILATGYPSLQRPKEISLRVKSNAATNPLLFLLRNQPP